MTSSEYMLAALAAVSGGLFLWLLLRHLWRQTQSRVRAARLRRARPDEVATLRAERERLRAEKAILRQQLEARITEMTETVAAAEARATRLTNELGETRARLEAREKTLAEREREIVRLKEIVATLESDLEKRTGELNETRDRLRRTEASLQDLEDRHARLRRERDRLEHRLSEARARLAALERKLEMRDAELEELRAARPSRQAAAGMAGSGTNAGKVVPLSPHRAPAGEGEEGPETRTSDIADLPRALMGQVIALDRLKAMLAGDRSSTRPGEGESKDKTATGTPATEKENASSAAPEEGELSRLRAELDELDRLWQERLAALREATERKD
jgi:archaellum component FlaC